MVGSYHSMRCRFEEELWAIRLVDAIIEVSAIFGFFHARDAATIVGNSCAPNLLGSNRWPEIRESGGVHMWPGSDAGFKVEFQIVASDQGIERQVRREKQIISVLNYEPFPSAIDSHAASCLKTASPARTRPDA